MKPKLEFVWDQNLREVAIDPLVLRKYVEDLHASLVTASEPDRKVSLLGELGVRLRSLGDLESAEKALKEALEIIDVHQLGLKREMQQKIRLAHVFQWKNQFDLSNALFGEVLNTCRGETDAKIYLDFALQHAGKNLFDQKRYKEALVCFEEALAIRLNQSSPEEQVESTRSAIARTKELLSS